MSVVGPRPALASEVEQWTDDVHDRLRVLPGITGMWQVSGRSDTTFDEYKRLDLYYVDNWSLAHDLRIVCATFARRAGQARRPLTHRSRRQFRDWRAGLLVSRPPPRGSGRAWNMYDEYDDGSGGRSPIRIIATVVGVLAILAAGWFLVKPRIGGSDDNGGNAAESTTSVAEAAAEAATTTAEADDEDAATTTEADASESTDAPTTTEAARDDGAGHDGRCDHRCADADHGSGSGGAGRSGRTRCCPTAALLRSSPSSATTRSRSPARCPTRLPSTGSPAWPSPTASSTCRPGQLPDDQPGRAAHRSVSGSSS